jgi:hypothetical protein
MHLARSAGLVARRRWPVIPYWLALTVLDLQRRRRPGGEIAVNRSRSTANRCTRMSGGIVWSYADPYAVLLDEEENLRTHRRGGSIERRPQSAPVTLENTRTATPSGVRQAVRKGSS